MLSRLAVILVVMAVGGGCTGQHKPTVVAQYEAWWRDLPMADRDRLLASPIPESCDLTATQPDDSEAREIVLWWCGLTEGQRAEFGRYQMVRKAEYRARGEESALRAAEELRASTRTIVPLAVYREPERIERPPQGRR